MSSTFNASLLIRTFSSTYLFIMMTIRIVILSMQFSIQTQYYYTTCFTGLSSFLHFGNGRMNLIKISELLIFNRIDNWKNNNTNFGGTQIWFRNQFDPILEFIGLIESWAIGTHSEPELKILLGNCWRNTKTNFVVMSVSGLAN